MSTRYDPFGKHRDEQFPYYEQARSGIPVDVNEKLGANVVTGHTDMAEIPNNPQEFSSSAAISDVAGSNTPAVQEVWVTSHKGPVRTRCDASPGAR
jgi:cytochrome P450